MAKRQVLVICLSIAATLVPQSRLRLASDSRSTGLGGTMPEQKVRILKEYPDVFWFVRPEGYLRANPSGPGIGRNQALKMKRSGRKVLLPKALDVPATLPKASGNLPFIGAEACGECHREKYEGFLRTAHHHTSREAVRNQSWVTLRRAVINSRPATPASFSEWKRKATNSTNACL